MGGHTRSDLGGLALKTKSTDLEKGTPERTEMIPNRPGSETSFLGETFTLSRTLLWRLLARNFRKHNIGEPSDQSLPEACVNRAKASDHRLHVYFQYNGLTIKAGSSDRADLNWLEEFLCPFFELVDGPDYDSQVTLIGDSQRFEEMLERGPRSDGAEADCFALESSWIRLPLWDSPCDEQVIFDQEHKVFYRTKPDREIEILTAADNKNSRIALMRVIREFAMIHSAQRGGLLIHGAAFSVGDHCMIVAGPKRAGKTSLLMHALRSGKTRFVSNDRVLVLLEKAGAMARGMPTIVTIRRESLEKFPDFYSRLETTSYDFTFSLDERPDRSTCADREGRFSLSPAQFCRFLQVSPSAQHQIGALVFPRISATKGSLDLELLTFEKAFGRLRAGSFPS